MWAAHGGGGGGQQPLKAKRQTGRWAGGRVASASLSSLNIQQQLTTQFYTDPLIIKLVQTHSLEVMICN